jgi:tetratricopeptide (TPR) repeat protein
MPKVATPAPVSRVVAPGTIRPPIPPVRTGPPPRSFAVPPGLSPKGTAPPVESAPPATDLVDLDQEFVPTPTNLSAADLFADLAESQPVATQGVAGPAAAASPRRGAASEDGMELYRAKRWSEARTKLSEALRRDPRNRAVRIAYHLSVAHDLGEQGRAEEARKQFESVLVLDPENAEAIAALRNQSFERREEKRGFLKKLLDRE